MSSLQNTTQLGLDSSLIPHDAPSALLEVARLSLAARFTHLACGSVFVYDTLVVFREEHRLIWLAQPSLFKVCAIATRIAGFLNAALTMAAFLGNLTYDSRSCPPLALAMVSFCSAACLVGGCVLALRATAIYAFRRGIVILVTCAVIVETVCLAFATSRFKPVPLPRGVTGCIPAPPLATRWYIFLQIAPVVVVDLLLFSLTSVKAFKMYRNSHGTSTLADVLLRDGIMYYALVLISNSAAMIAFYFSSYGPILAPFATVLAPAFICHLCLNLRAITNPLSSNTASLVSPSSGIATRTLEEKLTVEDLLRVGCSRKPSKSEPRFSIMAHSTRTSVGRGRSGDRSDRQ